LPKKKDSLEKQGDSVSAKETQPQSDRGLKRVGGKKIKSKPADANKEKVQSKKEKPARSLKNSGEKEKLKMQTNGKKGARPSGRKSRPAEKKGNALLRRGGWGWGPPRKKNSVGPGKKAGKKRKLKNGGGNRPREEIMRKVKPD